MYKGITIGRHFLAAGITIKEEFSDMTLGVYAKRILFMDECRIEVYLALLRIEFWVGYTYERPTIHDNYDRITRMKQQKA